MTASTRLSRLYPTLNLEERLDGLLAAYRDDRQVGDHLITGVADAGEWNSIIDLLNATHAHLGWYTAYVEAQVTQVELRYGLFLQTYLGILLAERSMLALEPTDGETREWLAGRKADSERQLEGLQRLVAGDLAGRWLDVRLAELAADELSRRCYGRDILHPAVREKLSECTSRLQAVHEGLSHWLKVELPEPAEELVAHLVRVLVHGRRL